MTAKDKKKKKIWTKKRHRVESWINLLKKWYSIVLQRKRQTVTDFIITITKICHTDCKGTLKLRLCTRFLNCVESYLGLFNERKHFKKMQALIIFVLFIRSSAYSGFKKVYKTSVSSAFLSLIRDFLIELGVKLFKQNSAPLLFAVSMFAVVWHNEL